MKRKDLVPTRFTRTFGHQTYSYTCMSHPGIDFDEVLAMWLIYFFATLEWLKNNSQNGTIYLGVDGDGQRGVFNEHDARDKHNDHSECCATLVARSLGVHEDPQLKTVLAYALGQDVAAIGSKYDLAAALKAWRSVGWNNEEAIHWTFHGLNVWHEFSKVTPAHTPVWNQIAGGMLDFGRLGLLGGTSSLSWLHQGMKLFSELERLTTEATTYVKNTAEPHYVQTGTRRVAYWTVRSRSDQEFKGCVVSAFRQLGVSAELFINIEDSGHFQVFVPKNPALLEETFKGVVHRIFRNKKWLSPEIQSKSIAEQMDAIRKDTELGYEEAWGHWLYLHPGIGCIFNGSQTARPDPLIGDDFTLGDLVEVVEAAILRRNPQPPPRRTTSAPRRNERPAQNAPQPSPTSAATQK